MLKFKASGISVLEMDDLNAFMVVLAEEPDGGGKRIEFQRAIEFDEQDRQLGQDTYCLCTEQGQRVTAVSRRGGSLETS